MSKKINLFKHNNAFKAFKNQDLNSRRVVKNDRLEQETNENANTQILNSLQRYVNILYSSIFLMQGRFNIESVQC
jgi:hypothetical protein